MSERGILPQDQPFGVRRIGGAPIAGSRYLAPTAGAGPAKPTHHFKDKRVQFAGTFAGGWDVTLQGTVDGENWVPIQANVVAAAIVEVPDWWRELRLLTNAVGNLTAVGSPWGVADQPTFTASLGGFQLID